MSRHPEFTEPASALHQLLLTSCTPSCGSLSADDKLTPSLLLPAVRLAFRTFSSTKMTFQRGSSVQSFASRIDYKNSGGEDAPIHSFSSEMLWRRNRAWAVPALVSFFLVLLTWPTTSLSVAPQITSRAEQLEPPRHSTGLTDAVQWDNYTLFVNQQRIFL